MIYFHWWTSNSKSESSDSGSGSCSSIWKSSCSYIVSHVLPCKISLPLKIKDESEGVRHHHHQHGCHLFSSSNNIGLCSPITIFFHPDHFILILRNTKAMENFGMEGTHLWLKPHVLWQHEVLQVLVPEHFSFCRGIAHQSKHEGHCMHEVSLPCKLWLV